MTLTRREFLLSGGAIGSLAFKGGLKETPQPSLSAPDTQTLRVKPRYYRWHVDEGQDWTETNTRYATLDWEIPVSQCALVLVDVWQRHYIREPEERAEKIIDERLVPLIKVCREKKLEVIHAPALYAARAHPNWINLDTGPRPEKPAEKKSEEWPPRDFRHLSGEYSRYGRPVEPREAERLSLPPLRIHPKVEPIAGEVVIATGSELHLYLKKKGILFLFFAGFNTNGCILSRDYGTIEMSKRGYQALLVRDCTTGMESFETQATLAQTNGAILLLEMFGQYTVTSDEMIKGFSGYSK